MVARVAASGIRDLVSLAAVCDGAGVCRADGAGEDVCGELVFIGGGGVDAATFFLQALNVPHSTVTVTAAKSRDLMKTSNTSKIQDLSMVLVSRRNSIPDTAPVPAVR